VSLELAALLGIFIGFALGCIFGFADAMSLRRDKEM